MKLSTMRRVDYWVGIPLCFLISLFVRARRALVGSRMTPRPPHRVLFVELSEMGSTMLAYPAMRSMSAAYPGVELYFLIFARNRQSVDLLRFIPADRVLTIDDSGLVRFLISTLRTIGRLRALSIDTAIDLELFSRCTALLTFLSGASIRIGFDNARAEGLYRGSILTHPVLFNHHRHMADNFQALVAALDNHEDAPYVKVATRGECTLPQFVPALKNIEGLRRRMAERGWATDSREKLVLLNPDPGILELRAWPIEHYVSCASSILLARPDVKIGVIGLPQAQGMAEKILSALPSQRTINLVGVTESLEDLLTLFTLSAALITSDSGAAHFAPMTPIQSFVFFGPETPRLYKPLGDRATVFFSGLACSPCLWAENHRDSRCKDNRCLQVIRPEDVASAVVKCLVGENTGGK